MSGTVVQNGVDLLFQRIHAALEAELRDFADEVEAFTHMESFDHWDDDSGSARDSITAYSMAEGNFDKNTTKPDWEAAQSPGYMSPVWGNTSDNFQPEFEDVDIDGEQAVILTMFVRYAELLESGSKDPNGPPQKPDTLKRGERKPLVPDLIANSAARMKDKFVQVSEAAFQTAIG